jgi:hypothetical protein
MTTIGLDMELPTSDYVYNCKMATFQLHMHFYYSIELSRACIPMSGQHQQMSVVV